MNSILALFGKVDLACCDIMYYFADLFGITYYQMNVLFCCLLLDNLGFLYISIISGKFIKKVPKSRVIASLILIASLIVIIIHTYSVMCADWNQLAQQIIQDALNETIDYDCIMVTLYVIAPITQTIWFIINLASKIDKKLIIFDILFSIPLLAPNFIIWPFFDTYFIK